MMWVHVCLFHVFVAAIRGLDLRKYMTANETISNGKLTALCEINLHGEVAQNSRYLFDVVCDLFFDINVVRFQLFSTKCTRTIMK